MNNEEIRELLRDEIQAEFDKLNGFEVNDPEYKLIVDGLSKLMDREIKLEELDIRVEEEAKKRQAANDLAEFEKNLKQKQAEEAEAMAEFERNLRKEQAEFENSMKIKQMKAENKHRIIQIGVNVAGIVLPLIVTIWGTCKSISFEREGTHTTLVGRGHVNKLTR